MSMNAEQPAPTGSLGAVKHAQRTIVYDTHARATEARMERLRKTLVRDELGGHFLPRREALLHRNQHSSEWRKELLAWLRDHVNVGIPRWYYNMVLGHDLHISTFAQLFVEHYHATERDPFTGRMGWKENVGQVSCGKVTTAFRDFEALMLVTDATTMGDYKYHEVGTSAGAEANTEVALVTTSGIARVVGTQTNPSASTYQSVATVTADATETWQEHGLFNASTSVTLMDRSLISPTVAVVSLDTVTFTFVLTKNAES